MPWRWSLSQMATVTHSSCHDSTQRNLLAPRENQSRRSLLIRPLREAASLIRVRSDDFLDSFADSLFYLDGVIFRNLLSGRTGVYSCPSSPPLTTSISSSPFSLMCQFISCSLQRMQQKGRMHTEPLLQMKHGIEESHLLHVLHRRELMLLLQHQLR
ncbi:hypothetical protein PMAYCL1PPCAC_01113 [Pristionchus mayeri]|uniref:Uncharacterized protein n=1 Tax=Pristionchus mayeri TaxID=1317129 RepID=A0AAN5BZD2_9BILA|nr:hypothetical protein PMAYCL1PPCAC_01113 [Pristionchus mayeri]